MTLAQWWTMGGYGLYVWGSLGMCALVAVIELWALRAQRRALARAQASEPATPVPLRQPVLTRQEGAA